ncbi:hypothetical protein V6C20_06690 [Caldibacillus thermoamylovorans]
MSKVIGEWMVLIITVNIMFAPILTYVDSLHREAVEVVLSEGARKAAVQGQFTPSIIKEMKDNLVTNYNFAENKITINATQSLTSRGDYIKASIQIPRGKIFILDIFNQGPDYYKKEITVMSEYIN